ncbi:hypothetical protein NKH77_01775 [Streptomyces sp. M19]
MNSYTRRDAVPRRRLLRAGAVAGLAAAGWRALRAGTRRRSERPRSPGGGRAPVLTVGGARGEVLGSAYGAALTNLLDINTVPYDPVEYNQTGLMTDPPGVFIRAGGGYEQPWTRDASVNSWNAASLLSPDAARNTLWAVCRRQDDGTLIVQQDNQWWDQIVWAVAAWEHYLVTADRAFLRDAYQAAVTTLRADREGTSTRSTGCSRARRSCRTGSPAIRVRPTTRERLLVRARPPRRGQADVSVHQLPLPRRVSGVCLDGGGGRRPADGGRLPGLGGEAAHGDQRAPLAAGERELRVSDPRGRRARRSGRDISGGERAGVRGAVRVASPGRTRTLLAGTHHEPYGVVNVWPHFARFDDAHPGGTT